MLKDDEYIEYPEDKTTLVVCADCNQTIRLCDSEPREEWNGGVRCKKNCTPIG